jgi:hypothetical protein
MILASGNGKESIEYGTIYGPAFDLDAARSVYSLGHHVHFDARRSWRPL